MTAWLWPTCSGSRSPTRSWFFLPRILPKCHRARQLRREAVPPTVAVCQWPLWWATVPPAENATRRPRCASPAPPQPRKSICCTRRPEADRVTPLPPDAAPSAGPHLKASVRGRRWGRGDGSPDGSADLPIPQRVLSPPARNAVAEPFGPRPPPTTHSARHRCSGGCAGVAARRQRRTFAPCPPTAGGRGSEPVPTAPQPRHTSASAAALGWLPLTLTVSASVAIY